MLRARIEGFRCLDDVEVHFAPVTRVIGPNGVGKSSILRALDWFFNGGALDESDRSVRSATGRIRVEVEFSDLTDRDRQSLGRYAPSGSSSVVLWKTLTDGHTSVSGNARTYLDFQAIRSAGGAMERRRAYKDFCEAQPEMNLPSAATVQAVDDAMVAWEAANPDRLTDAEEASTTEFFGFLGAAKLSGIFDYVFVSADLRAGEEAESNRGALIGRLLQRSVSQTVVTEKINALIDEFDQAQQAVVETELSEQLNSLGARLTASVGAFSDERKITLSAEVQSPKRSALTFGTTIVDGDAETLITGQGHGFQRALLLGALKLIAEQGHDGGTTGTILLAIEEPELFQHPAQARTFARVLRQLSDDVTTGIQVLYATHSPLFIEPGRFEEIRRLHRASTHATAISVASAASVQASLSHVMNPDDVTKQIDRVCPRQLSEAVFADTVILVEGETDRSLIEALLERFRPELMVKNFSVVEVSGKLSLPLADAVLRALGIRTLMVVDNDEDKRLEDVNDGDDRERSRHQSALDSNHRLLKAADSPLQDWPTGLVGDRLYFIAPGLEGFLQNAWPEWHEARERLIETGEGFGGKHGMTYTNATREAGGVPPADLLRTFDSLFAPPVPVKSPSDERTLT